MIKIATINALAPACGGFAMPAYEAGRTWLCASPEFKAQVSFQGTGVHAARIATTDVLVPLTGAPAWSPPN